MTIKAGAPVLDHPALPIIKAAFADVAFKAGEFRGRTFLVVPAERLHAVMRHLHDDPACDYDFLADVVGIDYLGYPVPMPGRFSVAYPLSGTSHGGHLVVKTYLTPTLDTSGIVPDPGLEVDSVTDIWPGAEWPEREVFDMFGIRFRNHPDMRRLLLWRDYPAHPLRKDYPLRGRGERERYATLDRTSS